MGFSLLSVNGALLSIYRALLSVTKTRCVRTLQDTRLYICDITLVGEYRALLSVNRDLVSVYRALLCVYRTRVSVYRALLSVYRNCFECM